MGEKAGDRERIGFLFLGELHLIPHLFPIAAAVARRPDAPAITLHVATSVHEEILADALRRLSLPQVTIRRVRGFVEAAAGSRDSPRLPSKPLVLALNARRFLSEDVVVVAERTSLWVPYVARRRSPPFVHNEHGAGPHANHGSPRNRHAAVTLMPSDGMADRMREAGGTETPIKVVGYIKPDYIRELATPEALPRFPERRPTVIYVPHWKRDKSSWWGMGEAVLDWFARQDRFNLILAPHVRLPRFDPEFERRVAPYRDLPHIQVDATSFKLIDQTYVDGADIYLGDGSSQVVEFARRPRPVVFLNPDRRAWRDDPRFSHWSMGDVIEEVGALGEALAAAPARHALYADTQRAYVRRMMGPDDGLASERAADEVLAVLSGSRRRGRGRP